MSYDAGKTWVPAAAAPTGDGHYLAAWLNSAPKGSTPWLKVTATDAIGGSISQTVANAYHRLRRAGPDRAAERHGR